MRRRDDRQRTAKLIEHGRAHARLSLAGLLALTVLVAVETAILFGAERGQAIAVIALALATALTAHAFYVLGSFAKQRAGAGTDPRTGVLTIEGLAARLKQEAKRAMQSGTPTIVLYVDMVNLERVNQDFGYTTGDIVLGEMAQVIKQTARAGDVVGRVGGDEFMVIMPNCTLQEAEPALAIIRGGVNAYRLDLGKRGTIDYVSCKIGTAVFPTDGNSLEAIITAARAKMT